MNSRVNTPCVPGVFRAGQLAVPAKPKPGAVDHPSFVRLLECANAWARKRRQGRVTLTQLASLVGQTPQTITNWRRRGVSSAGAICAAAALDCSATYISEGIGPAFASESPPPVPNFGSRREMTDSDWATLDAVRVLFSPEEQAEFRRKAAELEARMRSIIGPKR